MRYEEVIVKARGRCLSNREAPHKVACLVNKSSDPPVHLRGYFSSISVALSVDKVLDEEKFTRAQLLKEVGTLFRSATVILNKIADPRLKSALVCGPYLSPNIPEIEAGMKDILKRVTYIENDQVLVSPSGDARSGSGTLRYPWPCSMKLWIAILIAAAMEHQHGELPKPRNASACDAAELLWVSIGGNPSGREQARNSWRAYIKEALQDRWAEDRKSIHGNIAFRKKVLDLRDAA